MEILAGNLSKLFENKELELHGTITYKGEMYEVWTVDDATHEKMCDMTEDDFVKYAGEDAWWRSCSGSVLKNSPIQKFVVKGQKMYGYATNYPCKSKKFDDLSDYLCRRIGCSQPKNVVAVSMDLAKINNMTLGELFKKYEG